MTAVIGFWQAGWVLAHHRQGSGEPMVLMHGIGHNRFAWDAVLDRLAAAYDAIAVDLPGFGDSEPLAAGIVPSYESIANSVAATMDELGVGRAHLVGNSLGGAVGLAMARMDRASTVVAISPAGFCNERERRYLATSLRVAVAGARLLMPLVQPLTRSSAGRALLVGQMVSRPSRMDQEATVRTVRRLVASAEAFKATMPALNEDAGGQVPVPVTVAWGSKDHLLFASQAPRAVESIPGARFVSLPGLGHLPMTDDPGMVASVILEGAAAVG